MGLAVLFQELLRNPTLSSRTFIWTDFVALAKANPIWGWGSTALIQSEMIWNFPGGEDRTAWGSDAHYLSFEALVRYGPLGLVAVLAIIMVSWLVALKGWGYTSSLCAALIAFMLLIGLTEHNIWWSSPGTAILFFVLSALGGGRVPTAGNHGT